jgi:hypothetical protein
MLRSTTHRYIDRYTSAFVSPKLRCDYSDDTFSGRPFTQQRIETEIESILTMKLIDGPPIPMGDIQSILNSSIPFGDENNPDEVEQCEVSTFDTFAKSMHR